MNDFTYGVRKGLPIGLGYLAVSFSFGVMVVNKGIAPVTGIIISATSLTSSGQYAGIEMMAQRASYFEIFLTIFLINLRYALMSLSLSQKIDDSIPTWQRLIFGFGITDEVYALAAIEYRKITFRYMLGLILMPFVGWILGTVLGVYASNIMPQKFLNAMGISLYAMFIALIIPDTRSNHKLIPVIAISIAISCMFYYIPYINRIGLGFKVIIATVISSLFGALVFPIKEDK